jgi:tetratricopeptide (TPR) repeat protein
MTQPSFAAKDRISLCMIVRNEEAKLARALASAAPWVGEMVVVDTGSTDQTVAIAESFGAKVVHFTWCDDFSAARNVALEAATGAWALVLDADEVLDVVDADEFTRAVAQDVIAGFSFRCHNHMDDGTVAIGTVFRLFRRDLPGMRYRGQLHEQVAAVADGQMATAALACCVIQHDGYTSEAVAQHDKTARNIALAEALVASRPDDPFAWFSLGLSQLSLSLAEAARAYETALALLEKRGESGAGESHVVRMYAELVKIYPHIGKARQVPALLERALGIFPHSPDLLIERAQARFNAGDFASAAADFEACLSPQARDFYCVLDPAAIAHGARTGLGMSWLQLGRNIEGEAMLESAVAEAPPAFGLPRRALGTLKLQRGDWESALPLLSAAIAVMPQDPETRHGLGWCMYKLDRLDEAAGVLAPLAARPDVLHLLGRIALERGDAAEALRLLDGCELPAADLARGWAHFVCGRAPQAAACWDKWIRAGAADWGTKDALATFLFLLHGGSRPSGEPERPAEPVRDMALWFRLLLRHERFDEVETVLKRGPELGARMWRLVRQAFGITLAREGFYDVGLGLLLEAREASPQDAEVYYWIGYCALHRQQPEEARLMWQTCLRMAEGHPLAQAGLSLLR